MPVALTHPAIVIAPLAMQATISRRFPGTGPIVAVTSRVRRPANVSLLVGMCWVVDADISSSVVVKKSWGENTTGQESSQG